MNTIPIPEATITWGGQSLKAKNVQIIDYQSQPRHLRDVPVYRKVTGKVIITWTPIVLSRKQRLRRRELARRMKRTLMLSSLKSEFHLVGKVEHAGKGFQFSAQELQAAPFIRPMDREQWGRQYLCEWDDYSWLKPGANCLYNDQTARVLTVDKNEAQIEYLNGRTGKLQTKWVSMGQLTRDPH